MKAVTLRSILALGALGMGACTDASGADMSVGKDFSVARLPGQRAFDTALPHTNGRSCGDCHVEEDHRALTPEHVQTLFIENPNAPLFHRLDADDPDAAT